MNFVNKIPPKPNNTFQDHQYRPERQIWDKVITLADLFQYWNKIGDLMKELDDMDIKTLDFHTGKDEENTCARLDIYLQRGTYPKNMDQQATEDFLYTWWNELKDILRCGLYIIPIKEVWENMENDLEISCYIMEPMGHIVSRH